MHDDREDGDDLRPLGEHEDGQSWFVDVHLPEWRATIEAARDTLFRFAMSIVNAQTVHLATRLIVNQAVSDFADVLHDADRLSGRSAMRGTRALIEHAINLRTVIDDKKQADRYIDHLDRGHVLMSEVDTGVRILPDAYGKATRRRLKTAGERAARRFTSALERHGSGFRRQWTSENLADRAEAQDQSSLYEFYRLASLTIHGSSASMIGARRPNEFGFVNRIGLDPGAAPPALFGALQAMWNILSTLENSNLPGDYDGAVDSLQAIVDWWAAYHQVAFSFEKAFFEDEERPVAPTIVAISRTGKRRWYVEDHRTPMWLRGTEPPLSTWEKEVLARLCQAIPKEAVEFQDPSVTWVGVRVPFALVPSVDLSARPIPNTAIPLYEAGDFLAFADEVREEEPEAFFQWDMDDHPITGAEPDWDTVAPPWARHRKRLAED